MTTQRNWRLSERHPVPTTPILWKVPKRRVTGGMNRPAFTDAAVIDISTVGAAIVCPKPWIAQVKDIVDIQWNGMEGQVKVRRVTNIAGSDTLMLYGVEFTSATAAVLGAAMFEALMGDSVRVRHDPLL